MPVHTTTNDYFNQDADENSFYKLDGIEQDTVDKDFIHQIVVVTDTPEVDGLVPHEEVNSSNLEMVTRRAARDLGLDEEVYVKRIREYFICQKEKEFISLILRKPQDDPKRK